MAGNDSKMEVEKSSGFTDFYIFLDAMIAGQKDCIKAWMLQTHRIDVQNDWLQACLDWIQEEQRESNTVNTPDSVKNLVFEQWLMSDLRELHSCCLPDSLQENIKATISGSFPLQIESIIDVGSSCYSQLQKVKGTENANVGVSADTSIQPGYWEPKPSKMLYLKLTDGTNDIQAMEYKPISSIGIDTVLGTKVLVHGDVICRRGVLLLTSDNTHVYGGEVDTLIEDNPPEQLLQQALEENMQHSGKGDSKQFSGKFIERGDNSFKKKESQSKCSTSGNQSNSQFSQIKQESSRINPSIKLETTTSQSELRNNTSSRSQTSYSNQQSSRLQNQPKPHVVQQSQNLLDSGWDDDFEDDMFMDDIDDNILLSIETPPVYPPSNPSRSTSNMTNRTAINSNQQTETISFNHSKIDSTGNSSHSVQQTIFNNGSAHTFSERTQGIKCQRESTGTPQSRNKRQRVEKQQKMENMFTSIKREVQVTKPAPTKSLNFNNNHQSAFAENNDHFEQFDDDFDCLNDDDFDLPDVNVSIVKPEVPKAVIHPFNSSCHGQNSINIIEPIVENTVEEIEPFTYISCISSRMPFMEERCFKIKAYISTLTSKLTSGQGEAWTIACKINDGSMAMDVDLSNTVLTGLIGFSAQDSIIMRKQARTDSSIKDVLLEGIQQCQQKLVDLSCILEIKVKAHSIRPMITQIINIKNQHLQSLLQRVERKLTVI